MPELAFKASPGPPHSHLWPLLTLTSSHTPHPPSHLSLVSSYLAFRFNMGATTFQKPASALCHSLCSPEPAVPLTPPRVITDGLGILKAGPMSCDHFLRKSGLPWSGGGGGGCCSAPMGCGGAYPRGTACAPAGCCRTGTGSHRRHRCRVLRGEMKQPF